MIRPASEIRKSADISQTTSSQGFYLFVWVFFFFFYKNIFIKFEYVDSRVKTCTHKLNTNTTDRCTSYSATCGVVCKLCEWLMKFT